MRNYLVGATALLALASASLGSAAGSSGTADAPRSSLSHVTSTASGQCSKAEAIDAVKRLGLRDASPTYPVYKVLCGAFTGTGSQTMVASISGSDNAGMIYWAVFRWSGSDWRLVMKQHQAAILTAAGSDIRETVSIYRDADSRCCPSGGTKTRIWHWNGARLTSSTWTQATPSQPGTGALHLFNFYSPSHNLSCSVGDEGLATCVSWNLPRSASLKLDGTLRICNGRRCVGRSTPFNPSVPVLGYGQRNDQGGFRCKSERVGITCTVILQGKGYGKGFLINSTGVSRVGR
jgi:hypothetical protein